jgi:multidrug efflux system membrane fusion protein
MPDEETSFMRRFVTAVGLTGAICLAGLAAWRAHGGASSSPPQPPSPPVPVVAEKIRPSDFPIVMSGIGTVVPYNVVDVRTQVTGTIEKIGFVEGQIVHPGSLIAQIDPRPYQAALQQAEADFARDQSHLANAQANLHRYLPLLKPGFASAQQVADQESAVTEQQAAVAADKGAIFNAQTQLGYTTITSPIDGVTGIRRVDIGNILQPSTSTPIVTITQIQPISVIFILPQNDVPAVQAAMAKGTLKTVAYSEDDRTKLGDGTLLLVNNSINQSAGTVQLKATFPNANRALWPGEFVNVRLIMSVQHNAVAVPLSALQQGQHGSFVYVVAADGTVHQSPVSIAETLDGRALIGRGVKAGDTVVTAGQYLLSNGVKVAQVPAGDPHVQTTTEVSAGML